MTREESVSNMSHDEMIDTLKGLVFGTFDRTTVKEREALNMAINALHREQEQQFLDAGYKNSRDAISRILKRMWNCRGKHTTSIDKVKMEQIIRDELSVTQKPIECEDAISREAVIERLKKEDKILYTTTGLNYLIRVIEGLPSVTPKPIECDDVVSREDKLIDLANAIESDDSGYWTNKRISSALRNKASVTQKSIECEDAVSLKDLEECEELMTDINGDVVYAVRMSDIRRLHYYVTQKPKIRHCKECKYFEYDSVAKVDGIPFIVAHEICNKWGDGCKTSEDGYCYLFEPQESEDKE